MKKVLQERLNLDVQMFDWNAMASHEPSPVTFEEDPITCECIVSIYDKEVRHGETKYCVLKILQEYTFVS